MEGRAAPCPQCWSWMDWTFLWCFLSSPLTLPSIEMPSGVALPSALIWSPRYVSWIQQVVKGVLSQELTVEKQSLYMHAFIFVESILWWWCSATQSCPTLCDPVDCSMSSFPVLHYLPEFAQIHDCRVGDAIQPSHPLSSPSPPALSLSQHQGLFQWVSSLNQVAKVLEFQLQHQSFQRIFRTDFV